jgi:hypothetical protein
VVSAGEVWGRGIQRRYLRCSVEKTKNRRIVVLEIRILEGAGISTDGEIENIPYLRISNRHLR